MRGRCGDGGALRGEGRITVGRSGTGEAARGPAFSPGAIAKGTCFSLLVTLLGATFLGLAVSLTEWEGIGAGLDGFAYVSIALGGMFAARQGRRLGWLHGIGVGLVYYAVTTLFFHGDFSLSKTLSSEWLLGALWAAIAGAIGGVVGVNL